MSSPSSSTASSVLLDRNMGSYGLPALPRIIVSHGRSLVLIPTAEGSGVTPSVIGAQGALVTTAALVQSTVHSGTFIGGFGAESQVHDATAQNAEASSSIRVGAKRIRDESGGSEDVSSSSDALNPRQRIRTAEALEETPEAPRPLPSSSEGDGQGGYYEDYSNSQGGPRIFSSSSSGSDRAPVLTQEVPLHLPVDQSMTPPPQRLMHEEEESSSVSERSSEDEDEDINDAQRRIGLPLLFGVSRAAHVGVGVLSTLHRLPTRERPPSVGHSEEEGEDAQLVGSENEGSIAEASLAANSSFRLEDGTEEEEFDDEGSSSRLEESPEREASIEPTPQAPQQNTEEGASVVSHSTVSRGQVSTPPLVVTLTGSAFSTPDGGKGYVVTYPHLSRLIGQ